MLKAIEHVIEDKWVSMYVKRWLEMKIVNKDGEEYDRGAKGTPQGGVISPLLSNLYLHFSLDKWLEQHYGHVKFVRYADDMVVHCQSKQEAEALLEAIKQRLTAVKLRSNEQKTQIVYCKDYRRKADHDKVQFGFLGFSFQPRKSSGASDKRTSYLAFTAEISRANQQKITGEIRTAVNWRDTQQDIVEISAKLNSRLTGWINYFGLYGKRELRRTMMRLEQRLVKWIKNKYKITSLNEG
jgi:group II intron reverse transcriptase/maturase